MDPITGLVTIVSLAADFVSQRRAGEDANLEEFKSWLADQRHEDIVRLLESNAATSVSTKVLLHESHAEIINRLEQLRLQTSSPKESNHVHIKGSADAVESIILGINNSYVGSPNDLSDMALRCAVHAIEGKRVEFRVELQETVLEKKPDDPLILPKYEKARQERAKQLKKRLELLSSQEIHEWWQYFLSRKEDWLSVMHSLIARADLSSDGIVTGQKIDVWRTEEPELSAPIYLSEQEVAEMLEHLGFQSTSELRFGPYWRSAIDLPVNLIVKQVLPAILVQLERRETPAFGDVLNLATWHIGEG